MCYNISFISLAAGAGEVTNLYTVEYIGNNNTGGVIPPIQNVTSNLDTYTFKVPSDEDYGLVKTNYGFMGWAENPNAIAPQYKAGATITLNSSNPSKTLYAVWQPGLLIITNMQEMTSAICAASTINDSKQLIDTREPQKKYWVAKLKDENCWITQNLDYDDPNGERRTGDAKPNSWPNTNATRQYWDPGEKVVSGSTLAVATDSTDRHLLVGNYYSWLSATNGTAPSNAGEASGSVCPNGWRLPSSNSSKGATYAGLQTAYNIGNTDGKLLNSPLYFLYSGYVNSGSLSSVGNGGYYWSSTSNGADSAYSLVFNSSSVSASTNNYRYSGFPIRCVAE